MSKRNRCICHLTTCSRLLARTIGTLALLALSVSPVAPQGKKAPLEMEIITIRPTGMDPDTVVRAKGPFRLAIDNRAGLDSVILRLDRVAGARVNEISLSKNKISGRVVLNLAPGSYVLSEATHPQWICNLRITD